MKPDEVDEPRSGHTTTKSVPMELEKPTGPVHHGGSSGSGIQQDDAPRTGATRNADARPLEATDVEMNAEDSCAAQVKRAKTIMGLEICVLEALDDVFDEPLETLTNVAGALGENETDEDVVSPEVTEELNRLKMLGRPYKSPQCGRADASDVCVQPEDQRNSSTNEWWQRAENESSARCVLRMRCS